MIINIVDHNGTSLFKISTNSSIEIIKSKFNVEVLDNEIIVDLSDEYKNSFDEGYYEGRDNGYEDGYSEGYRDCKYDLEDENSSYEKGYEDGYNAFFERIGIK